MPPGLSGRQTAPISMRSPKVYRPTMEEFSDFMGFIKKIEIEDKAHEVGFCKIIPPAEWIPRKSGYDLKDLNFTIEGPIKQVFRNVGEPGCYQTKGIIQPKMNVIEYKEMVQKSRYATPIHTDYDDLEKKYWRSVAYCPPIYGCDVSNTISDPELKIWNIAKLDSILKYVADDLDMSIQGVNTPYLYFGMWKATFSWHVEDMDLYAINMVHHGAPKTWYCVPPKYGHILERACKDLFPNIASGCSNFMRHKTCLLAPHILDKYGVPYQKMHQEEREIMVTFPYAYHSGFNHGFNIAESTNFATERWIDYGKRARPCDCERARVKFSMDTFVQKFQPDKYEAWKLGLDIEPHPEDPPDIRAEIEERAKDPKEFARQIEEKNRQKQRKREKERKSTSDKETIFEAQVYQLVVNKRIEIEVESEPFKVLSSLHVLEKYLQRKNLDVKQMMESGELVWAGTRPIQISKKRKHQEEAPVTATIKEEPGEPKVEKPAEAKENILVEKKAVALYKHVIEDGLHVSVDPITKVLTNKPSDRLMSFIKENNNMSVKALIEAGVFVKICDCIMEVKKVEKDVATNDTEETAIPESKKIKLEQPEPEAEIENLTPNTKHVKQLGVYRHKGSGYYYTLSKSFKVIGRLSKEKEAIFEGKTVQDLIDEGELRRVGERKLRDQIKPSKPEEPIRRALFKLAWDEKSTKIELAAKGDRFVCGLVCYNQNIATVLEESNCQLLSETLTLLPKDQDSLHTPKKLFEAMLNSSMSTECILKLLQKNYPESDFIKNTHDSQSSITWKDSKSGQFYLVRNETLGIEVFDINRVKNPIAPTTPATAPITDRDESDFDDDDDDEELFTSDESSESNDESSDDPDYYGSGHYGEWKSACRSLKKQKKRREREERRQRRLARKGAAGGERKRKSFKEEAPVYLSLTKTLLKKGQELREMGHFTIESLAMQLFEGSNKIKLTNIIRIFSGLKIVKQKVDEEEECKYAWHGYSFENMQEVLLEIISQPFDKLETKEMFWNVTIHVLKALVSSPKGSRVFLPLIANNAYENGEKKRFQIVGIVMEALGLAKKKTDELGGHVYNGPNVYSEYCKHLYEEYGIGELSDEKKEVRLVLQHVQVQEEQTYPIVPPQYKAVVVSKSVYDNIDPELEKERSIQNQDRVCRCGTQKTLNEAVKIDRFGGKKHERKTVYIGGKRKKRCKRCENCLRDPCRKCNECLNPKLKKPCTLRICLFPIVPNCPCFD